MTLVILLLAACDGGKEPSPDPGDGVDTGVTADARLTDAGAHADAAFLAVSGTSPDNVYVAGADPGAGGLALRWDGTAWTELPNPWAYDLWWVHALPGGPTFFAGSGATVLEWDGVSMTRHRTPGIAKDTVYGLWAAAPDDVWAVGGWAGRWGFVWHYDGATWQAVDLPDDVPLTDAGELPAMFKVWGRGPDDVYFVGGNGAILHWDGAAMSVVPSGTSERLFTVTGDADRVVVVGGNNAGIVLTGDASGFADATPPGAPVLQGVTVDPSGSSWVTGADAAVFHEVDGGWAYVQSALSVAPESLHGAWHDGEALWAVGGAVLSGALDDGVITRTAAVTPYAPRDVGTVPPPSCPADRVDIAPDGSIARRWNELLIDSIRRDLPRPGVHARNLFHASVAMWDAWAAYDAVADGVLSTERVESADPATDREIAISYATYRVLRHRYATAIGGEVSADCYDAFMDVLGLDPDDTHTDGDDPIAVGNRIGQRVIDAYADDGANEAANYADTTGYVSVNEPMIVDEPGCDVVDPDLWTPLNIALAEAQNGIVLDSGLQSYIGSSWGYVEPFATGPLASPEPLPSVFDPEMKDWVVDVVVKTAWLDPADDTLVDISPGALGDNPLGTNDGTGHAINPVTGAPYAPNVVKRSDFGRVLAEFWADGPQSETPPGHWNVLANGVSDVLDPADLRIGGVGDPVDRLQWDVSLYLALNGATHDAAITAWGAKRESLSGRPIQYIRWMAEHGQSSDPTQPSHHPDGLPLVPGVIELITAESSAPGERHHDLRWFVGEVAVYTWLGEPGDRDNEVGGHGWVRALEWIPYQRRTFVTPAFPGFISGHSTFSRAGAEALTRFTGSPWFPGGLGEFTANEHAYLHFESGPSETITLQWGTYQDAADQAGQSRIWGGIHVWPDDWVGRVLGAEVGEAAWALAATHFDGTAR